MSARLRNLNSGGGKVGTISQLKNRTSTTSLNKTFTLASLILVVVATQSVPSQAQKTAMTPEMVTMFEQKVRPTLEAKCIACHGPKQQSANLRLDKPINARMAYKVAEAISYETDPEMPPSGKLPVDQLAAMTAWAKAGAPWPTTPKVAPKTKGKFWSFIAPKKPTLPKVKLKGWAANPLDAFILAKLEEKGLKPAPAADRRTLIRRATFDLTGLPPTPQEVEEFLADKSPNAFEKVVDQLLASNAYGERWGRHWLDVARYADSNGLDENLAFVNAWRYRDYVIESMNADKPIDRFFQEQIAGDLMPNAGDDEIIATGYLALGGKMLAEDDPVKQEMDIIDEQVDTLSKSFLGLTVGCARCHDHKFDPISAKDYYAMAGIFKSTKTMENFRVVADWYERPIGSKINQEKVKEINAKIGEKSEVLNKRRKSEKEALSKQLQPMASTYEAAAKQLIANEKNKANLKPAIDASNGAVPKGSMVVEAESFFTGNVTRDTGGYGKGIGVLVNHGDMPNRVEYQVSVPSAGAYQLDLRYASNDSRSIRVYANGELVLSNAAAKTTGGFYPEHQRWFAEGIFLLNAGVNYLKFERDEYFPHLDKFLLTPKLGQSPTETVDTRTAEGRLIPELVRDVAERIKRGEPAKIEIPDNPERYLAPAVAADLKRLDQEIKSLEKSRPKIPMTMAVGEGKPTNLKVHLRGNYLTLGDDSPRRFPSIIATPSDPVVPSDKSGRLELAKWLTSANNPLTARVFVNRVWRWRFGRGIVGSVDNFGALGDLPTHPELLDWLATSFVGEDKWSLKKLHKRMMLTNTYMMSGQYDSRAANLDPDNHYLWRFPRKRLEAEAIRDNIMAVSGRLDRTVGGTMLGFGPRAYVTGTDGVDRVNYNSTRRGVYLPVVRAALYDVYTAFDFGDPTVMNGDRSSTTVAPQALFMLNSQVVLSSTKAMAEKILQQKNLSDAQKIRQLYMQCYGRPATEAEVSRTVDFLGRFMNVYAKAKDPRLSAWQSLCKSIIAANEFIYVE